MGLRGSKDSIPYSTAKGGVINLTRCLAVDLAKYNINVNAICPGFINTRMALLPDGSGHEYETDMFKDVYLKHERIPLIRTGKSEDISGPAFFLCSKDSDYITGQMLLVDGGISAIFWLTKEFSFIPFSSLLIENVFPDSGKYSQSFSSIPSVAEEPTRFL